MTRLKEGMKKLIDVEMIPAKVTFFFTDGYGGAISPFINVFFVSLGLSATQAGIISGISLAVSSLFNPLWSIVADVTGRRKLIFVIMCIGTAALVFSMPWVALAVRETTLVSNCTNYNYTYNATTYCKNEMHQLTNRNTVFYTFLGLTICGWIFFTSVRSYVEGLVSNVVQIKKRTYGKQRVFSSLGHACINFLTGVLCDLYRPKDMSEYTTIFYVFLPCIIIVAPWGCKLIGMANWDNNSSENNSDKSKKGLTSVRHQFSTVFSNLDFIIFFLSVIVFGLLLNVFNGFLFLLMEKELGTSKTVMTSAIAVSVVLEIFFLEFSRKFMKLCRGEINAFTLGIFSFFPRFMVIAYTSKVWLVIAIQCLHGLGMGLGWAAVVEYASNVFPREIQVTGIALLSGIAFNATYAVSNMVGGVLYDEYGGRPLFKGFGIFAAVWFLIMTLFYWIRRRKKRDTDTNGISAERGVVNPIELNESI